MALTSAEHDAVRAQTKRGRHAAAAERRAAGWGYTKIKINVSIINTLDALGQPIVLATSDVPAERGRWFQLTRVGGRPACSCGAYRSLGGCHHVGHVASLEHDASPTA